MTQQSTSADEVLDDESPPEAPRTRLTRPTVFRLLGLFVAARLVVTFVALASVWLSNGKQTIYGALTKWDSGWYAFISEQGYPNFTIAGDSGGNRWAFFPGWPMLMRGTQSVFGGTWQRNGLMLSIVLGLVTVVLLYLLVGDVFGERVAFAAVTLFVFAPPAALLSMVYSEALFIPACIACLLFLQRGRWWLAGVAAFVGGMTRISAIALVVACVIEATLVFRRTRSVTPFVAPLLAALGLATFFVYQRIRVGTFSAYSTAQHYWGNGSSLGGPVLRTFTRLLTETAAWREPPAVLVPVVLALAAGCVVMLVRSSGVPRSWWVYTVVLGGIAISPSLTYSIPRLVLPIVPLFAGAAARIPARWFPVVAAASAVLMCIFGLLYFNTQSFQMAP